MIWTTKIAYQGQASHYKALSILKEKAVVGTFSKYCEFWSRSTSSVDVICCRSNRIVSITTTLQKKLVEIERCKDISLKIEQQELSYSPGRINMVSFRIFSPFSWKFLDCGTLGGPANFSWIHEYKLQIVCLWTCVNSYSYIIIFIIILRSYESKGVLYFIQMKCPKFNIGIMLIRISLSHHYFLDLLSLTPCSTKRSTLCNGTHIQIIWRKPLMRWCYPVSLLM